MTLDPSFLLFVPGDRPERFAKALAAGATGAILDCEDAVAFDRKAVARQAIRTFLVSSEDRSHIAVRVNAPQCDAGRADLTAFADAPRPAAVVVPKVERAEELDLVTQSFGATPQIALVESGRGLVRVEEIARAPNVIALAIGYYDLAADLGAEAAEDVLLPHRARILVAARAARRYAIDGPSREYGDPSVPGNAARHVCRLGYDGKLLIHPAQVQPVRAAFAPSEQQVLYARRVLEAAETASPAVLDGTMIDAPIVLAAERTLERASIGATATARL